MLDKISNTMYFNSDDEFFRFAVVPMLVIKEWPSDSEQKRYYRDFNLSKNYHQAVNDGKIFVIKDPNSQIFKHQAVSYRALTKPIENLEDWVVNKNFKF